MLESGIERPNAISKLSEPILNFTVIWDTEGESRAAPIRRTQIPMKA
jgi:hypothetical protein